MVQERHNPKRRNMLAESRLISEWVAATYPGRGAHFQYRVGSTPDIPGIDITDEGEVAWARSVNRRVDAVIEPPPELVVVEAKMWDASSAIGRLQEYLLLLPASPDFPRWRGYPIVPVLLTAQHDPVAQHLAEKSGIRYVFWEPDWIGEWYAMYPARRRRAPHIGLVERLVSRAEWSAADTRGVDLRSTAPLEPDTGASG